jgi:hypothetical protein
MKTGNRMSQRSRRDYLQSIHARCQKADRREKQRVLDELCASCCYHRKHAIRLLNQARPGKPVQPRRRRRGQTYGPKTISVLKAVWEAADYPWSVRLKALLPGWMPWIRRRFRLKAETERKLRRRLYGRPKPGTLLKHPIRLKTDHWDMEAPGFTEIDPVSHLGNSAAGDFSYSLNLTDIFIFTGWTETKPVLGKSQEAVRAARASIRQALFFALRGIDSYYGVEFINDHLYRYCRAEGIQFTRGRPYKKDDNSHIEQKNWTHVRRLLGYLRYNSLEAQEAINDLYRGEVWWFQNLFLPSVKLAGKQRIGSKLRRHYEAPQTPLERLESSRKADPARLAELQEQWARLDPFELSETIEGKRIFARNCEAAAPAAGHRWLPVRSSSSSRQGQSPSAVEITGRGKRGKLLKQKRVSPASLRPWKSSPKAKTPDFHISHSAYGSG